MNKVKQLIEKLRNFKIERKKESYSLDDILIMYVDKMDSIFGETFPSREEHQLFKDLARVDGLRDYLRVTSTKDIQRYFASTVDKERDTVRGALARTVYLQGKLVKSSDDGVVDTKVPGLRYKK
jgi:hypothetical protein